MRPPDDAQGATSRLRAWVPAVPSEIERLKRVLRIVIGQWQLRPRTAAALSTREPSCENPRPAARE
jgi:hypothetical protein